MTADCAHPSWIRRPDEDNGLFCRFRCMHCGAALRRRFDEPDSQIRPFRFTAGAPRPAPHDKPLWDFGEDSERRVYSDRYGFPQWLGREVGA